MHRQCWRTGIGTHGLVTVRLALSPFFCTNCCIPRSRPGGMTFDFPSKTSPFELVTKGTLLPRALRHDVTFKTDSYAHMHACMRACVRVYVRACMGCSSNACMQKRPDSRRLLMRRYPEPFAFHKSRSYGVHGDLTRHGAPLLHLPQGPEIHIARFDTNQNTDKRFLCGSKSLLMPQ